MLTDVTIRALRGDPLDADLQSAPFVLVSHASLLIPLDEG